MKNLQIRNVPDDTHSILRKRASEAGVSLQEYLLQEINMLARKPSVAELLARVSKRKGGKAPFTTSVNMLRGERSQH